MCEERGEWGVVAGLRLTGEGKQQNSNIHNSLAKPAQTRATEALQQNLLPNNIVILKYNSIGLQILADLMRLIYD